MRRRPIAVAVIITVAFAVWWWWPDEARRVRRQLERMADAVSRPSHESDFDRLARAATLSSAMSPDAVLHVESVTIEGRDRLLAAARGLAIHTPNLHVTLDDVDIVVSDDRSRADAQLVARTNDDARALRISLVRRDGEWLVDVIDVVPALRRPGASRER